MCVVFEAKVDTRYIYFVNVCVVLRISMCAMALDPFFRRGDKGVVIHFFHHASTKHDIIYKPVTCFLSMDIASVFMVNTILFFGVIQWGDTFCIRRFNFHTGGHAFCVSIYVFLFVSIRFFHCAM